MSSTDEETVIRAAQHCLIHGVQSLETLPKIVLKIGKGRLWARVSPRGRGPFVDFADFASHPLPDGLGCEVGRLIELCRGNVEAIAFLEAESGLADSADPPPRVLNLKHDEIGDAVYVGRAMPRRGLAGSAFGNPYHVGRDGTREEVIEAYRRWLLGQPALLDRLHELRGRRLACWCSPAACHGDVLAELVDADELLDELKAAGVRVEASGDRLRLSPASKLDEALVARVRPHKPAILALLASRPTRPDATETWLKVVDRLAAEHDVPPETLVELKAATAKWR